MAGKDSEWLAAIALFCAISSGSLIDGNEDEEDATDAGKAGVESALVSSLTLSAEEVGDDVKVAIVWLGIVDEATFGATSLLVVIQSTS